MGWGKNELLLDLAQMYSANKQFFYLLDKQSARLAKRLGRKEWAGVPAMKEGKTDFQIAQVHAKHYVWQTPGQQYFYYQNLQKLIDKVYPEVNTGHNPKGIE